MSDSEPKTAAEVRHAVLGDHYPGDDLAKEGFARPLIDWSRTSVWDTWARPGIPLATRCIVTVTVLAVLNRPELLAVHLRGALRNGVSESQLGEILTHVGVYGGVAAASDAMRVLRGVLREMKAENAGS